LNSATVCSLAEEGGGGGEGSSERVRVAKDRTYGLKPTTFMLIMIKCKCLMYTLIKNIIYIHQKPKETKT